MLTQLRRSAIFCLICLVLFGLVFPLLGVGLSQLFFKHQADGSITANGSTLIGQNWSQTKCPGHLPGSCVFQGRPGRPRALLRTPTPRPPTRPGTPATTRSWPTGVAGESGATNLGPRSQELSTTPRSSSSTGRPGASSPTSDLVTTSGSGIDPDITPQDAQAEIPMVSRATGLSAATLST